MQEDTSIERITNSNQSNQNGQRNIKEPLFYGTKEIPQPYIIAVGEVGATGVFLNTAGNSLIKTPLNMTISKTGSKYTIKHSLALKKYIVYITPLGATPAYYSVVKTPSQIEVNLNVDSDFNFAIIAIS